MVKEKKEMKDALVFKVSISKKGMEELIQGWADMDNPVEDAADAIRELFYLPEGEGVDVRKEVVVEEEGEERSWDFGDKEIVGSEEFEKGLGMFDLTAFEILPDAMILLVEIESDLGVLITRQQAREILGDLRSGKRSTEEIYKWIIANGRNTEKALEGFDQC